MEHLDQVLKIVDLAILEDIGDGDHSSLGSISEKRIGKAELIIKESGVLAGVELAALILQRIDPSCNFLPGMDDGALVRSGDRAFAVEGKVHSLLQAERIMLNFMQRLSGVASYTKRLVDIISDTGAILLDTRKTTPGMRALEKWAVRIGGAQNHRYGLYDMVMLKDNHIDFAGGITEAVELMVQYLKRKQLELPIEVETRNINEVREALETGMVNRIMFDNFSPALIKEAVEIVSERCETEASGGIKENNIRAYAETGVDFISVGALTHSVNGLDMSLKQY
jgi:nicotinate-nucleotide pyrophosphorylase (carboxylating)